MPLPGKNTCTRCHRSHEACVCHDDSRALASAMREANRKYMRKHLGGRRACDR